MGGPVLLALSAISDTFSDMGELELKYGIATNGKRNVRTILKYATLVADPVIVGYL